MNNKVCESMADYKTRSPSSRNQLPFQRIPTAGLERSVRVWISQRSYPAAPMSEKEMTHRMAMELAQAMEAADQNAKSIKAAEPSIHQFSAPSPLPAPSPCHRCGRKNHKYQYCYFREATCHILLEERPHLYSVPIADPGRRSMPSLHATEA